MARTAAYFRQAQVAQTSQDRYRALEGVVLINMSVALSIAWRYRNRGIALEDLEQTACLALVLAAQRFDPTQSRDFLTFAVPTISGEVKKHFRDQGWMVRPPRSIQELQPLVEREQERISGAEQGAGLVREIAERLGSPHESVAQALRAEGCFAVLSLDKPVRGDATSVLGDLIVNPGDRTEEATEARAMLGPVLREVSEQDRRLLRLRFVEDRTQQEIAEILGVTQTQVSRLLARVLRHLRAELAPHLERSAA